MEDFYPNKNHGPDSGIGSDNGEKRLSTTEVSIFYCDLFCFTILLEHWNRDFCAYLSLFCLKIWSLYFMTKTEKRHADF